MAAPEQLKPPTRTNPGQVMRAYGLPASTLAAVKLLADLESLCEKVRAATFGSLPDVEISMTQAHQQLWDWCLAQKEHS